MDELPINYADYTYKNYGNTNKSVVTENGSIITWLFGDSREGGEGGITMGHKEILGDDARVHCPDCGDCFTGTWHLWHVSDCTLSMVYANYASVKLLNMQTVLLTQWPESLDLSLRCGKGNRLPTLGCISWGWWERQSGTPWEGYSSFQGGPSYWIWNHHKTKQEFRDKSTYLCYWRSSPWL